MAAQRRWRAGVRVLLMLMGGLPVMAVAHDASHDGAADGEASSYYQQVEDYQARHPEQRELMVEFAGRVQAAPVPITHPPERPVRIATVYPGHQASEYWRRSGLALARRLEQLQIPFELKTFFSRPGVEVGLQGQQLAEALAWQPDYLAFTLGVVPHGRMIERLLAQQGMRLILQNITTPLRHWEGAQPFLYVGFDHAQGTRLLAEHMLERVDYDGKYLMLYYAQGYVSEMRGGTFEAVAAHYPGLEQVGAFFTDNDAQKAYRATRRTLADHPDLEMIFASSTDIALGALRALREADRQDVLINGWGGGKTELAALRQGELDLTVMRMNDDNGIAMAEAIKLDLMQQAAKVPQIFAGQVELVDDRISPEDLARLERRAFRLSDPEGDAAQGDSE